MKKFVRVLMIVILFLSFCFIIGCKAKTSKIGVPLSSKECKGEDYKYISEVFEKAGFNNIITEENKIMALDFITKENTVKEVRIGTTNKFDKNDAFEKDERVKIIYNVKK